MKRTRSCSYPPFLIFREMLGVLWIRICYQTVPLVDIYQLTSMKTGKKEKVLIIYHLYYQPMISCHSLMAILFLLKSFFKDIYFLLLILVTSDTMKFWLFFLSGSGDPRKMYFYHVYLEIQILCNEINHKLFRAFVHLYFYLVYLGL